MKKLALYWQILIAFALSVLYGLFFSEHVHLVAWMGDIFIKALKMIIIPLIFTSIISGIANVGSRDNLGRLGFKTIAYYLSTSTAALFTGLVIVNLFKPGVGADLGFANQVEGLGVAKESFGSTLMNIVPNNLFVAMVENQMLSIIFFAILMGFFITKTKKKVKKYYLVFLIPYSN